MFALTAIAMEVLFKKLGSPIFDVRAAALKSLRFKLENKLVEVGMIGVLMNNARILIIDACFVSLCCVYVYV